MNRTCKKLMLTFCLCTVAFASKTMAQDVFWKKNFGGIGGDYYNDVVAVSDGYVAVGYSDLGSFGSAGDWYNYTGQGYQDAIIVKYDDKGNVRWKRRFGGFGNDVFTSVTELTDGYVAVGYSAHVSFGNGDWGDIGSRGTGESATIVKFNKNGQLVWRRNFGGGTVAQFSSVTTLSDGGVVAVGYVKGGFEANFTFDLAGYTGRGGDDAIIAKYNSANGSPIWRKLLGGAGDDYFNAVTTVSDGLVVVGRSDNISFGDDDWNGVTWKGGATDCTIVKYNKDGGIVWKKNFGGAGPVPIPSNGGESIESFSSVTAVPDGVIAVGYAQSNCFGTWDWFPDSDWKGIAFNNSGATMVKFNTAGSVVWKKHFGSGSDYNGYNSVTTLPDGVIAMGGYLASDGYFIVKHDFDGNEIWKRVLPGEYRSVAATDNNVVVVGKVYETLFNTGDWAGVKGKGYYDAVIVNYTNPGVKLSGTVKYPDGTPVKIDNGVCVLYRKISATEYVTVNVVSIWEEGNFTFSYNVVAGQYIIGVGQEYTAHGTKYNLINSYYTHTLDWKAATVIHVSDADIDGIDIVAFPSGTLPSGGSSIGGYVGYVDKPDGARATATSEVEYPVASVNVRLQQYTGDWSTILQSVTDEDGYFEFQDLPAGTYRAILDIPGLEMLNTIDIKLDDDDASLEFVITDEGIQTIGTNVSITDINGGNGIVVYPNPTSGLITICDMRCARCDIAIFDVMGRAVVVAQSYIENRTSQITFDLSNLPAGVYLIRITTAAGGVVTKKVIKF